MDIKVIGGEMSPRETQLYIDNIRRKNPKRMIKSAEIKIDGDYVDVNYSFEDVPFERIRRITGYLTGTLSNWNDAKKSEEKDRVKHNVT